MLEQATLLHKVTVTAPYPMAAVNLFTWNESSSCTISPRVFIFWIRIGVVWSHLVCRNDGVDLGLLLSEVLDIILDFGRGLPVSRPESLHLGATFPRWQLLHFEGA